MSYDHSILGNFHYYYLVLCSLLIASSVGPSESGGAPEFMADSNLKAEKFVEGLEKPTSMAFLGPDDIIVLEKNKGTVMRVVNGVILDEPLLDLNVAYRHERGLLGVAVANDDNQIKDGDRDNRKSSDHFNVYLYFTTGEINDGEDTGQVGVFRNSLYRYELVSNGSRLENPKLLFELPRDNHSFHNGGALLVGPDNNIYVATGDLSQPYNSTVQNVKNGSSPSGTGGILRFTGDGGTAVGENGSILSDTSPLNRYYAYGIRNSFGLDFDPISGKLWDTENGPFYGDEINIVEPGFNSGWSAVQGIWRPTEDLKSGELVANPEDLVTFNQKGKYSSPEFIWKPPVGPTAIKFLNSDKLGRGYQNDMFVGDIEGNLYHFDLDKNRTALDIEDENGRLADKVADTTSELNGVILARGFGGITDIEVGYDGYLYVLSHRGGSIDRIIPNDKPINEN